MIISKLLVGKLKKVIRKLVSTNQYTFIYIISMFGVVVINELMDFARRNKKDMFLFKVNIKKVFDSTSWDYFLYAPIG